jgi:hypothetical protein
MKKPCKMKCFCNEEMIYKSSHQPYFEYEGEEKYKCSCGIRYCYHFSYGAQESFYEKDIGFYTLVWHIEKDEIFIVDNVSADNKTIDLNIEYKHLFSDKIDEDRIKQIIKTVNILQ